MNSFSRHTLLGWVIIALLVSGVIGLWISALPIIRKKINLSHFSSTESSEGRISGRSAHEMSAHFLNVGYGDGIFIQGPENTNTLINGGLGKNSHGANGKSGSWTERVYLPIFDRFGIKTIHNLIVTMQKSHHMGVQSDLLSYRKFEFKRLFTLNSTPDIHSYRRMLILARNRDLDKFTLSEGSELSLGTRIKSKVLRGTGSGGKETSAVLILQYGSIRILILPDLTSDQVTDLVLTWGRDLEADVLKVGRHGAESASSKRLLHYVDPKFAVISTSSSNPLDAPADRVRSDLLEAGVKKIFRTDRHGTIGVFTDGRDIRVLPHRFQWTSPSS